MRLNETERFPVGQCPYDPVVYTTPSKQRSVLCSYHELDYAWVAQETWVFERTFELDAATLCCGNRAFLMTGVDTAATFYLNGRAITTLGNAFRLSVSFSLLRN